MRQRTAGYRDEEFRIACAGYPFQPAVTVTDDGVPGDVRKLALFASSCMDIVEPQALDTAMFSDLFKVVHEIELVANDTEFGIHAVLYVYGDQAPTLHE